MRSGISAKGMQIPLMPHSSQRREAREVRFGCRPIPRSNKTSWPTRVRPGSVFATKRRAPKAKPTSGSRSQSKDRIFICRAPLTIPAYKTGIGCARCGRVGFFPQCMSHDTIRIGWRSAASTDVRFGEEALSDLRRRSVTSRSRCISRQERPSRRGDGRGYEGSNALRRYRERRLVRQVATGAMPDRSSSTEEDALPRMPSLRAVMEWR